MITPVAPAEAYAKFLRIGEWWSDAHSYSGAAANMTLDTARGGCWCESWPGGFVEHMAVTTAMPGRLRKKVRKLERLVASLTKGSAA